MFFLFTLNALFFQSAVLFYTSTTHGQIPLENPPLRGLEEISTRNLSIDSWTQLLHQKIKHSNRTPPSQERHSPDALIQLEINIKNWSAANPTLKSFFKNILNYVSHVEINHPEHMKALSYILLHVREQLRSNDRGLESPTSSHSTVETRKLRKKLYLLQVLAEEALHLGYLYWPEQMALKSSRSDFEMILQDHITDPYRAARAGSFAIQTGDIILSKATGNGSSFFISTIAQEPSIFSHSALNWVPPKRDWAYSTLIESLMEDGTKLRVLNWLEYSKKTRIYIYRYKNSSAYPEIAYRTDEFVSRMQIKVKDPYQDAAFGYDLSMDPLLNEGQRYFCSAVSWSAFRDSSTHFPLLNPYATPFWSEVAGGRALLLKTLEIHETKIPAPGDVELNPFWSLVGLRINLKSLPQERTEAAIVESFLSLLESHQSALSTIVAHLDQIGDKPLSRQELLKLSQSSSVPENYKKIIQSRITEIPENANLKQLVFFFFLNEILTPNLRTELIRQQEIAFANGQIIALSELRGLALSKVRPIAQSFQKKWLQWFKVLNTQSTSPLSSSNCLGVFH